MGDEEIVIYERSGTTRKDEWEIAPWLTCLIHVIYWYIKVVYGEQAMEARSSGSHNKIH